MSSIPPGTMIATEQRSPHNRLVTLLLAFFFGVFGVHRFYVGKIWTGLFYLFTGGGFGFLWMLDIFMILIGRFRDGEGRVLGPPQYTAKLAAGPGRQQIGANPYAKPQRQLGGPQKSQLQPAQPAKPEPNPYEEEAMLDPLQEKFEALERELKGKKP